MITVKSTISNHILSHIAKISEVEAGGRILTCRIFCCLPHCQILEKVADRNTMAFSDQETLLSELNERYQKTYKFTRILIRP